MVHGLKGVEILAVDAVGELLRSVSGVQVESVNRPRSADIPIIDKVFGLQSRRVFSFTNQSLARSRS